MRNRISGYLETSDTLKEISEIKLDQKKVRITFAGITLIFIAALTGDLIRKQNILHKATEINYNLKDHFNELYHKSINYSLQKNPQTDNLELKLLQDNL